MHHASATHAPLCSNSRTSNAPQGPHITDHCHTPHNFLSMCPYISALYHSWCYWSHVLGSTQLLVTYLGAMHQKGELSLQNKSNWVLGYEFNCRLVRYLGFLYLQPLIVIIVEFREWWPENHPVGFLPLDFPHS